MPDDPRHLLAALLASPNLALIGVDLHDTTTTWSRGASRIFGWKESEALGRPLPLEAPADRSREPASIRASVLRGEDIPALETVRLAKDGTPVPVEMHAFAVRDEARRPVGALVVYRDLRREKEAEAALSVSAQELHARFESSPVPQSRFRLRDSRTIAVNAAMEELLGRDRTAIIGQDGMLLYAEEDRAGVAASLDRLASGEIFHAEHERTLLRPDGERRQVRLNVTTISDSDASPVLAVSAEDVTDLRRAEQSIRAQADRFEMLLESMPLAVCLFDAEGRCTYSRGRALDHLDLAQDQMVGESLLEQSVGFPDAVAALQDCLAGRDGKATVEAGGRTWKGHYRPVYDDAGVLVGGMAVAVDVSGLARAEREVRANEARLRSLLQHASDVVGVIAADGRILYVSPAVTELFGYEEAGLFWRDYQDFYHPQDKEQAVEAFRRVKADPAAVVRLELRVRHADGTWRWADHVLTNLVDDPAVLGVVVHVRETTERRQAEAELQRLALQDELTGLANRALLLDRVGQALAWEQRSGGQVGLVVVDVVGMRALNDRLGQGGGDAVLQALAQRLLSVARATDSVARVGGDEFAVLIEDVASAEDVRARASALLSAVAEPVLVDGTAVEVRLHLGTALSPAPDAGSLLAAAERTVRPGAPAVTATRVPAGPEPADLAATADLHRAIGAGELRLHFQPVLSLDTGAMAGAEALVRWEHPERGLLAPSEFIPLAERSGLVVALGKWVLREACRRAAGWQAAGQPFGVGVNLSPRQLVGTGFPVLVREVLAETGARADLLVLEVTESTFMDAPEAAENLQALRAMGVRLALDDFGTGYSSLTYLRRFPIDAIKIDRSFVAGLGRDADDEAIVASVVSLARAVGKIVVAEGVETLGQLAALRGLGVDQAQGFLWTRPLPAGELDAWRADRARDTAVDLPSVEASAVSVASERPAVPAAGVESRILGLHLQGASLHTIAAALNAEGLRTAGGPRWTTTTVARAVAALIQPR